MKICVIGGTGNISTSLVRHLLKQGHEVTCFNRGQSGEVPKGASWMQGDRRDHAAFERTMQGKPFDAAIDMLCFDRADAASSVRAFAHVQHFIQCSTVGTYGIAHDWMPVTEDHPLRPTTAYGRHKAQADAVFLEAYERLFFTRRRCLRIAVGLAVTYLLIVGFAMVFEEHLIFVPSRYPIGDWHPVGLQCEDVVFGTQDGVRLHGWYCPVPRPRCVFLMAHGNAATLPTALTASRRGSDPPCIRVPVRLSWLWTEHRAAQRARRVP